MKVVNFIQRYPPAIGGSEYWCRENCQYMAGKGMQVTVLTTDLYNIEEFYKKPDKTGQLVQLGRLDYDGKVLVKRYKITRFPPWCYRVFTSSKLVGSIFGFFFCSPHSLEMYFKAIKEMKNADLIHLHTLPYFHNLVGLILAKLWRKRVVFTPHFHPGHPHYERKTIYMMLKKCDGIITVSESEKTYLIKKGINPEKLFVSGNWINPNIYHKHDVLQFRKLLFDKYKVRAEDKIIVFIGMKHMHKGLPTLIEAIEEINRESNFRTLLFLVGPTSTEFREYYSTIAEKSKENIVDMGVITHQQKVNLLHASEMLVLPSEFEAFGIVLLEAWICGKPVITCISGASREIVGNAGLLFKYGDKQDLKEKIKAILSDKELAQTLVENGRKKLIANYVAGVIGKKIFHCYNSVRNNRKKILLVSHLFPPNFMGGSELVAYQQAADLKKKGHQIHIFCGKLDNRCKRYKTTWEKRPFNVTRINLHQYDFDSRSFVNYSKEEVQAEFRRTLYEFSPDTVHFHNIYALSVMMIDICNDLGIPTAMTLHDYWPLCYKNIAVRDNGKFCQADNIDCLYCQARLQDEGKSHLSLSMRNRLLKTSFDKINCFISPSRYLAAVFSKSWLANNKIKVINNGINLQRFAQVAKEKVRRKNNSRISFSFIGHLAPHKGVENLLLAFSLLKNRERAKLILAGKSNWPDYEVFVKKLGLGKYIKLTEQVPNEYINQLYRQTDVLILPSIWPENAPVSIVEAMACGIPVIASDVGGVRELVNDGVTGRLFNYWDSTQLAEKMEEFIANPQQIEIMGSKGFAKIQQFNLDNQVDLLVQEYERIIDEQA